MDHKMSNLPLNHSLHSAQAHPISRHWQSQGCCNFSPKDFVYPLFVLNEDSQSEPVKSFPSVNRMGSSILMDHLEPLVQLGLSSVLLFPCLQGEGTKQVNDAFDVAKNPLLRLVPQLKNRFPSLLVMADVCLCTFNPNGHCCVFDSKGQIDNHKSVQVLAELALKYAQAGVDVVAPSDMMDGRVAAMRQLLNAHQLAHVSVLSYAAKFESCFYGPFRDAAGSSPQFGDRKCYQLPSGSSGLALRAVDRDISEGADLVMVKPAMAYLDIVRSIATQYPSIPIAVYQVSGEYSMLVEGGQKSIFDFKRVVLEVLTSFRRAGASIIITYLTPTILQWINDKQI